MATMLSRWGSLGWIATHTVGSRCLGRWEWLQKRQRQSMIQRLGALHGLPQKIAQILSLREITMPEKNFSELTERSCLIPARKLQAHLRRQLPGDAWDGIESISPRGIGASIATVHRARLRNGRDIAIKIRHRGIEDHIETDLASLGLLAAPIGGLKKEFDAAAFRTTLEGMIRQELNFRNEAEQLNAFKPWLEELPCLRAPEPLPEMCGDGVLTMTWLEGAAPAVMQTWNNWQRTMAATDLTRFFLRQVMDWRRLHADPHAGNLRCRLGKDGRPVIGLLDFGCVSNLKPEFSNGFKALAIQALEGNGNPETCFQTLKSMGFNSALLQPMRDRLPKTISAIFEPFLKSHGRFDTEGYNRRIKDTLGPWRMNFRFAAPADVMWFLRAWAGLVQHLSALQASADWRTLLEEEIARTQPVQPTPESPTHTQTPAMNSEILHILVSDHGETKVDLTFGAQAAANLDSLVPLELKERLAKRDIDLAAIASRSVANDFEPGNLFEIEEEGRNVRIWLE